jgi:hypothetical protein
MLDIIASVMRNKKKILVIINITLDIFRKKTEIVKSKTRYDRKFQKESSSNFISGSADW